MKSSLHEFKNAIRCGTGDAILLLKAHPDIDFDAYILEACLSNLAYDPQIEGARVTYLIDILALSKNQDRLKTRIIASLRTAKDDGWDTYQLFRLVAAFAAHGDTYAKESLYYRYTKNLSTDYDYIETDALLEVDGLDGFLFSVMTMVKYTEIDTDFWIDDSLLYSIQEYLPDTDIYSFLNDCAKNNSDIQFYLAQTHVQKWLNRKSNPEPKMKQITKNHSYSEVLSQIKNGQSIRRMTARKMKPDDLIRLSKDFEKTENLAHQKAFLKLFSVIPYPGSITHLISFLYSNDEPNVRYAVMSLSKLKSPSIRLMLDNADDDFLKGKVSLFTNHFVDSDVDKLDKLFSLISNEHEQHNFVSDIVDLVEANGAKPVAELLMRIFNINNCSLCRESLIIASIKDNSIDHYILKSLKYDSDLDIRKLAQE